MGKSQSTEVPSQEYATPWRNTPWGENKLLEKKLKELKLSDPNTKYVRILVIGAIGAGKSSFINSVNSVFQRRITNEALVNKTSDSRTFTKLYKTYYIRNGESGQNLPFVLSDTMGLEYEDLHGVHPEDIVKAMEGCIKERYKFNPSCPISSQDEGYRSNPSLQDQTYCLVFVLAGDNVSRMNDAVIRKMKYIRCKANELEIPQAVVMTRVDEVCPLVKENLRNVYKSKRIKDKLEECSKHTGVSLSQVYPVKSYHEEIDTQEDIDVLILRAFTDIVQVANDALEIKSINENYE